MILNFNDGLDLRISCDQRDNIFATIKSSFAVLAPGMLLKVFGVNQPTLKDFKSGNNKHRFDNEPDEQFRLRDQEV